MLVYSGGSKGGVGKSVVSALALNGFINDGQDPIIIDTDNSNPDVYKAYINDFGDNRAYSYNFDLIDDWAKILDVIENNKTSPIIINGPARDLTTMVNNDFGLFQNYDIRMIWTINEKIDGLVLLKRYFKEFNVRACVIRNGFFADENMFLEWEKSEIKQHIQSLYLPKCRLTKVMELYQGKSRTPLHILPTKLTIGENIIATRWLTQATKIVQEAINIADYYK